ncbi:MAG: hypothetical protein ACREWJ_10555, partial [Rhodoferax sp.]
PLLAVLSLVFTQVAVAEPCLGMTALKAAENFYRGHEDFAFANPATLRGLMTERLDAALAYEYRCDAGDVCAIDFDPWTGAQDGDIRQPIRFALASGDDDHAVVTMRYDFALDRTRRLWQSATVQLERGASGRCWRVADVMSPDGVSVLHAGEEFRARHGHR